MVELSILTINYNTSEATIALIKSIFDKTENILFEVIIVDNASQLSDFKNLESKLNELNHQNVKLVRSLINTGFGNGNLLGYQKKSISSDYVVFINNDVELLDDCFFTLKKYLEDNEGIGIISPQSVNENLDFVPTIDHFATWQREVFTRKILEIFVPSRFPKRKKIYYEPITADFVAGSFMFMRCKDFDEIGGFDKNIFLYYEETDLSRKMLGINKKTILYPQLKYKHIHGLSTKKSLVIKLEQKLSLIYIVNKYQGFLASKVLVFYFCVKYFFSTLLNPKKKVLFIAALKGFPMKLSLKYKQEYKEE